MFAVFFPQGQHAYDGNIQFVNYCLLRASQFFSPFTLHPVYLLIMYAVRQVSLSWPCECNAGVASFCWIEPRHQVQTNCLMISVCEKRVDIVG